jgi:hypothetical protein
METESLFIATALAAASKTAAVSWEAMIAISRFGGVVY